MELLSFSVVIFLSNSNILFLLDWEVDLMALKKSNATPSSAESTGIVFLERNAIHLSNLQPPVLKTLPILTKNSHQEHQEVM